MNKFGSPLKKIVVSCSKSAYPKKAIYRIYDPQIASYSTLQTTNHSTSIGSSSNQLVPVEKISKELIVYQPPTGGGQHSNFQDNTQDPDDNWDDSLWKAWVVFRNTFIGAGVLFITSKFVCGEMDGKSFFQALWDGFYRKLRVDRTLSHLLEEDKPASLPQDTLDTALRVAKVLHEHEKLLTFGYDFFFDSRDIPVQFRSLVLDSNGRILQEWEDRLEESIQDFLYTALSLYGKSLSARELERRFALEKYPWIAWTLDKVGALDGVIKRKEEKALKALKQNPELNPATFVSKKIATRLDSETLKKQIEQTAKSYSSYASGFIAGGVLPSVIIGMGARKFLGIGRWGALGLTVSLGVFSMIGGYKNAKHSFKASFKQRALALPTYLENFGVTKVHAARMADDLALFGVTPEQLSQFLEWATQELSSNPKMRCSPELAREIVSRGLLVFWLTLEAEKKKGQQASERD